MADATINTAIGQNDGSVVAFTWNLTTADPTGTAVEYTEWSDATWHITNTTWGGATLALQGSNDGTNFFNMNNAAGSTALTFTTGTDVGATSIETPRYIRPKLTVVGVGAVVRVILVRRRQTRMRA